MSFLASVADHLIGNHSGSLEHCTVVFPNRRAGLFLKKELSKRLDKPIWSPNTLSLEDYLFSFSPIKKADSLTLIYELYESFLAHQAERVGFESFYHWGDMMLKDFEEIDHYLTNPEQVFTYVKDEKELAEKFYFLDPEQESIIRKFWKEFLPNATDMQQKFLETWKILDPIYSTFKQRLEQKGIGYTSHIYRSCLNHLDRIHIKGHQKIVFAGFNALTPVEERLLKHFVIEFGAELLWDFDAYYINDEQQEAGNFLRRYCKDKVFASSFPSDQPENVTKERKMEVIGVSLEVGQAKVVSEKVQKLIRAGAKPEEIVVVLPQDYMLFPVLNSIPPEVEKVNVTMGYPFKETPLYGLMEAVIELQEQTQLSGENGLSFYYKAALDILGHPLLFSQEKNSLDKLVKEIKRRNQVRIYQKDIGALRWPVLDAIFQKLNGNIIDYLQEILVRLDDSLQERFGLEREYIYHSRQLLSKLEDAIGPHSVELDLRTFKSLFKKVAQSIKIPFSGEPVEGLQIMGVLETRNLDFKHVLMLNMNEGTFPGSSKAGSFIPYSVRRVFGLPTQEVQDSIYAYLFYRMLHSSDDLVFTYNSFADFGLSGELSRYIRQYEFEVENLVTRSMLSNSVKVKEVDEITIETTIEVLQKLLIYTDQVPEKEQRRLSASALNTYLDCRLKFYFRYILRLFTEEEMTEELDARHFGNVLHKTLEYLYLDTLHYKDSRSIDDNDFFRLENSIDGAVEKAFKNEFGMKEKRRFEFKDRNVVMAEVIKKFARRVIAMDKEYAPFEMVSMESEDKYERFLQINSGQGVIGAKLGADIDRVDRKGETIRVLDYKTGRDETDIGEFEYIFNADVPYKYKSARKAGYQTFFYAWLYAAKYGLGHQITPGLINIKQVFQESFDNRLKLKGRPIDDARSYFDVFERKLVDLLEEIFSMSEPFSQTEDLQRCKFCDYKGICNR